MMMANAWALENEAAEEKKKEAEFKGNVDYMMKHLKDSPPEPGCIGPPATTPEEQENQNNQL